MSTTSLPSYVAPSFTRTPTYTAEPQAYEQRLALNRTQARPSGNFIKSSKTGGVSLRLSAQDSEAELPTYGCGASVEGTVDLSKTDGISFVEVKIEGSLKLKEIAEGGTNTHKLCLTRMTLWSRDRNTGSCPSSLPFSLALPTTFTDGKDQYPLPPTYESKALLPIKNLNSVTTSFTYYPRSRPAVPIPSPMIITSSLPGVIDSPEWKCFESIMPSKQRGGQDILSKLYIPASRVFCINEAIPFHLIFSSSAHSLVSYLPYAPVTSSFTSSRQHTKIQILRQSSVDVRNTLIMGTKTDIWRVVSIGEGIFRHASDGPEFISFVGEIRVNQQIKIGGFKAGGLFIKDCIVLSMSPPDPVKTPFGELRNVIPIRLTTDPWSDDGSGPFAPSEYSVPSTPEDAAHSGNPFADYRETD
ncbi:hypothetical protein C8Q75DRAFT_370739 [Abortiporus biennis]|nr:hypothetical protein C8Q75DRAFT_370739 [Abortiporus biennis]